MVDFEIIKNYTLEQYINAKRHLPSLEHRDAAIFESIAISDAIPGYEAQKLEFGEFNKDYFAVLFIDMRGSTKRAMTIGPEKTFLSMHAFIPAMLKVVEYYNGYVIDLMGDGIMVFFGGKKSTISKVEAAQNAGLCGLDMLSTLDKVVNPILIDDGITYRISCGVGVDIGEVIVTKIGINSAFDVKAFGNCINIASKYSNESNKVKVSKAVRKKWPSGEGGKIHFVSFDNGDGYVISDGR